MTKPFVYRPFHLDDDDFDASRCAASVVVDIHTYRQCKRKPKGDGPVCAIGDGPATAKLCAAHGGGVVKPKPVWHTCPGITSDGRFGHSMRDNCWSCAPFWEVYPVCPDGHGKLTSKGYCEKCRKHFDIDTRPARDAAEVTS